MRQLKRLTTRHCASKRDCRSERRDDGCYHDGPMHMMETAMKKILALGALLVSLGLVSVAYAQTGSVKILSPADGAKLDAFDQNRINYEVIPGPKADHVHLYVDGKEVAILRELKGSHTLETLAPGKHELCVKVVNKAHVPIGVEQCIKAQVE